MGLIGSRTGRVTADLGRGMAGSSAGPCRLSLPSRRRARDRFIARIAASDTADERTEGLSRYPDRAGRGRGVREGGLVGRGQLVTDSRLNEIRRRIGDLVRGASELAGRGGSVVEATRCHVELRSIFHTLRLPGGDWRLAAGLD